MSIIPDPGHSARNPLAAAQVALGKAAGHLRDWHARRSTLGRTYVDEGHDALARIDEAIGELYRARGVLVDELRQDQDQRAERVDRLIAEGRERFGPHDEAGEAGSGPGGLPPDPGNEPEPVGDEGMTESSPHEGGEPR